MIDLYLSNRITVLDPFEIVALVEFSNEPRSKLVPSWKRAAWEQEICLLIRAASLRAASRFFHRGLRKCFDKDYKQLFGVPYSARIDNYASGLSPIYISAAG